MTQFVSSSGDDRTANNAMRHQYKVLSEKEKQQMVEIKDKGLELFQVIDSLGQEVPEARELEIAKQKAEEAVMWAVKYLTR